MDLDELEKKLHRISDDLKKEDHRFNKLIEEKEYQLANQAYKSYLSQYSQEYIEMSEYYYGPELPYDVYIKEFKKEKVKEGDTYLDSGKDVKELYSLFIFFMFFDLFTRNARHFQSSSDVDQQIYH